MLLTASKNGRDGGSAPRDSLVTNSTGGETTMKATSAGNADRIHVGAGGRIGAGNAESAEDACARIVGMPLDRRDKPDELARREGRAVEHV